MALTHEFVSAAVASPDPEMVDGPKWNADHIVDGDGIKFISSNVAPAAPAANSLVLFSRNLAGASLPAFRDQTGIDSMLQPFMGRSKVGIWSSFGNQNLGPQSLGLAPAVGTGTTTTRTMNTSSFYGATRWAGMTSAATAGSSAGFRSDRLQFWLGNAPGLGGFRMVARFGCGDGLAVADARSFVGMVGVTTTLGNVNPSTNTNIIGVGTDSGESTLSVMHNDGSGNATKIALGANFPDHTLRADVYELALYSAPNSGVVDYEVTRLNTGDVARGQITIDLPALTTLLTFQSWRNNGTTASAVIADLSTLYIETEY